MLSALNHSVLVLNRNWTAVHVTSANRALVLLYGDRARVVTDDYATHDFESWRDLSAVMETVSKVATPSFQIAVPEVIILNHFHKVPPRQVKFSRRNIYIRDAHTCQYCGKVPPKEELTIDHVIPRSRGGRTTWENVVLACLRCNMKKGSKLVNEAGLKLRTEPKKPHWMVCSQFQVKSPVSSLWQKFLDSAYWNVQLDEQ